MLRFVSLIIIAFITQVAVAQQSCRIFATDSSELQVCYFTTGQMSTEIASRKSNKQWHTLKAYDLYGHEIYTRSYGQQYGASNVELTYYPSGAIYIARYIVLPDSGSQRTDITTYFTVDGKVDHELDNSVDKTGEQKHDQIIYPGHVPLPAKPGKPVSPPSTNLYLINYTSETLMLAAQSKDIAAPPFAREIDPADTFLVGTYYATPGTQNPMDHYSMRIVTKPRRGYEYLIRYIEGYKSDKEYVMVTLHRAEKK
jgi:hypothetical protein